MNDELKAVANREVPVAMSILVDTFPDIKTYCVEVEGANKTLIEFLTTMPDPYNQPHDFSEWNRKRILAFEGAS